MEKFIIYYRKPNSGDRVVIDVTDSRNDMAIVYRKYLGTEDIYNISVRDFNYEDYKSSFIFGTKFLFENKVSA